MADITKRSNGSYRVRFLSVYGKRESKTFKDALTAKRFKAEAEIVETNIKTGVVTLQPAIPKTMSELFTYWLENRAVLKRKPKDDQSIIKRHLEEHFASLLIKNVNVEVLDRFNAVLRQKGLSAKTISNILTLLGSMIRLAHELE